MRRTGRAGRAVRTMRARRRGWGGVAGMALACGVVVAGALVPLHDTPAPDGAVYQGPGTHAGQAAAPDDSEQSGNAANTCVGPNQVLSLDPAKGTTTGAAVQRIRNHGYLTVGVDQNSYQWGFRDPATGAFAGFDIDLVKAIAEDILGPNPTIHYRTVPTALRFEALKNDKDGSANDRVDMVVRTVTVNCQRTALAAFSAPYFTAGQQILVPKDSTITGYDDSLKGKTLCVADGSTGLDVLTRKIPTSPASLAGADPKHGANLVTVDNQLDCLVLLQLHKADAVFTDNALGAGQAAQDPTVHLVGQPVTVEPYGVAMNAGDTDLVRRVNKVLAAYAADGRWKSAYDNWLAHDLPGLKPPPQPQYK